VIAAVFAAGLTACGSDGGNVPTTAVATVDKQPITNAEFDHWLKVVARTQQQQDPKAKKSKKLVLPKPGSAEYKQLTSQVMQFLVSSRWIAGEAAKRDLSASPDEIKRSFERTRDQSFPTKKAYERFLATSGQTQQDIDFRVKSDVLATKVRQEVTKDAQDVSDSDVEQYYKQNEAQFSQPERRDLQVVVNKDEAKAKEALTRLQKGESFKKVVKDLSTDPATKQQDGRLLGIAKGQQEKALDNAVFAAQKDQLAGPIKTQQGYYVFKVNKVTPATKQSLDQSREGIRQLLISQTQQNALNNFTTGFRKDWRGKTKCRKPYVIPDCSNGEDTSQVAAGPPAVGSGGQPPALGGASLVPQAGASPTGAPGGLPGAAPTAGGGAPPAVGAGGQPPALGGVQALPGAAPGGVPQGVPQGVPPQGGQQQAPPQQSAPPGG
jgi:foldase protein PrsA